MRQDRPRVNDDVRYWIATAPVGAASVLAEELTQFGASEMRERSHDVKFQGTLEVGYRACLWSRTATRVLLSVGSIDASSAKSIFEAVKRIDWREHLAPGRDAGVRLQRRQRVHPPYDLRLAAAERCGLRQPARRHRRAPKHPARATRCAAAPARRGARSAVVGGFFRREPASARLSHRGRPRAAQGERGGGGAVARRLVGHREGRGFSRRSHVRFRHLSNRSGLDRRRRRTVARARVLRLQRLARTRRRAVGASAGRGARAPRCTRAAAVHLRVGHRPGCRAHGDRATAHARASRTGCT